MDALANANAIRSHRHQLKAELKRGQRSGRDVLSAPESELATMKVYELLLALPKVGRTKANKMLGVARISPSKTIGGLTERQRRELAALMPVFRVM